MLLGAHTGAIFHPESVGSTNPTFVLFLLPEMVFAWTVFVFTQIEEKSMFYPRFKDEHCVNVGITFSTSALITEYKIRKFKPTLEITGCPERKQQSWPWCLNS
jgi:hypothetical protein